MTGPTVTSGAALHFGLLLGLFGSAVLAFLYFWRKGRLDMEQEVAEQMLENNEFHPQSAGERKERDS